MVSVPCNQDSLFSIRKSFDSEKDYKEFTKSFETANEEEIKMMRSIKAGITDVQDGHYHTVEMDDQGNGVTTYASHMSNHAHKVVNGIGDVLGPDLGGVGKILYGFDLISDIRGKAEGLLGIQAVSYTHLTLPTNREV